MLRRLHVRTRLVAVIAVPLVLLLAVAGPEALQRRERAVDADSAASSSEEVADVAGAVHALQAERTIAAASRAGGRAEVADALRDQRATTDDAVDRAAAALSRLADLHPDLRSPAADAQAWLDGLEQIRAELDASTSSVAWIDPFAPLLEALLEVQDVAGSLASDLGVGDGLATVVLVARSKEAAAQQEAQLAAAAVWGELRGEQGLILANQRADEVAHRTAYLAASPIDLRDGRRTELLQGTGAIAGRTVDDVVGGDPPLELRTWLDLGATRQQVLREVEAARTAEALAAAEAIEASSRRSSTGYLLLAGTGLLLVLALALAAARSITRPLRELTDAADHLAGERLPRLVDALRHPVEDDDDDFAATLEPLAVRSRDELGHLAHAFNAVQSVVVDVASEQALLLKKGISDLYVNLARRNQALIDRQIQLLDQLEVGEQDEDVLEHLYLLDHLATRMRRNAESLLVLAGAESGPRRSKPIDVVDVVRAALSEVEEYERIDLGTLATATVHGPAVSDVAHLLSELLENATHFSPPDTSVRVDGTRTGDSYQLIITDRGVGMRREQLYDLNALLRDPPVTGLALGRALGCLVAARLAARHGITVRLRAGEQEGVVAYVILPAHLLAEGASDPRPTPEPLLPTAAVERVDPVPAPASLRDALPTRSEFDADIQALLEREGGPTIVDSPAPVHEPPTAGEDLSTALRRRVPGATTEAVPEPIADPPVRRSPDEVRTLLSRYRSGLQAGRASDGTADEEPS